MLRGKTVVLFVSFLFLCSLLHSQTFQDGPGNEPDGNFPSKRELINGSSEMKTAKDGKILLNTK